VQRFGQLHLRERTAFAQRAQIGRQIVFDLRHAPIVAHATRFFKQFHRGESCFRMLSFSENALSCARKKSRKRKGAILLYFSVRLLTISIYDPQGGFLP
jgi:hypothetical protein